MSEDLQGWILELEDTRNLLAHGKEAVTESHAQIGDAESKWKSLAYNFGQYSKAMALAWNRLAKAYARQEKLRKKITRLNKKIENARVLS